MLDVEERIDFLGTQGTSTCHSHNQPRHTMASVAVSRVAVSRAQLTSRSALAAKRISAPNPIRARAFRGGSTIVMVSRVEKSEGEWKKELDQFSFQVLRKKGTEPAGTGEYDKFYPTEGHFVCKGCGNPLYSAESKFNSGCGWCVARFPRRRFPPPRSTTTPLPPGSTTILNVLLFRHPLFSSIFPGLLSISATRVRSSPRLT